MSATHGGNTEMPKTVGFYELAKSRAHVPAVIGSDGSELTFRALGQRVNRLANALRALGVSVGDTFAVIAHNGVEYLELTLAAGQIGALMVPLNWRLSVDERLYILRDSAAKVLIADVEQARDMPLDQLPAHRYAIGGDDGPGSVPGWSGYGALRQNESDLPPDRRRIGGWMAYTSGTTGRPKGVRSILPGVDPEVIVSLVAMLPRRYGIDSDSGVHLVVSPLYHAAPGGHAMAFLHAGHTIVLRERFDAEQLLRDIERYHVTTVHLVPTHFHRLLQLPGEVRSRYDLTSLQAVIHAGAPCPVPIKKRMIEWLGPIVWEYLGSTEGVVSQIGSEQWLTKPGSVGRPLPGLTVKIMNEGREVAAGEPGTIYFGQPGQAPTFAYHHDPAKTADGRLGDLVTAGDYGYLDDDGFLFMLDRRTDLIISGGVNIYPAEVEQHLITHPAVNDVAVVGVPDPEWGQQVLAVVQLVEGVAHGPDLAAELREHCARHLASFKCPRRVEFVSDFPRSDAGKVQRRVLRDRYSEYSDDVQDPVPTIEKEQP